MVIDTIMKNYHLRKRGLSCNTILKKNKKERTNESKLAMARARNFSRFQTGAKSVYEADHLICCQIKQRTQLNG